MRKITLNLLLTSALALSFSPAYALQAAEETAVFERTITVDINAQPLDQAIRAFSRQADVQVLVNPALVKAKTAPAVKGEFTTVEAFEALLAGSGLTFEKVGGGFVLRAGKARPRTAADSRVDGMPAAISGGGLAFEEIVVTGRAGVGGLRKVETSYAMTTLGGEQLRETGPLSTADMLKSVPGFWVEASGGEASNNIRVRGIPRDGYSSVSLQEDGVALQHDGGLGYLNADQSFRFDETIERVEVVRGGPAPIFSSNAPGGIVNFITRRPVDEAEGVVKVEVGDYNHQRVDLYYGAPIGNGWYMSAGGFFRVSDGVRDPGFRANEGGQFRFAVGRDFEKGRFDLNIKHLDDTVAFYLPVPLTYDADGNVAGIPGFDPNYGTLAGPDNANVMLRNVYEPYFFDLTKGSHTKLTQITANLELEVMDDWQLKNGFRYRDSKTLRNGLFPTGNVTKASDQLNAVRGAALASFAGATDVEYRYASDPNASFDVANQNGNGLVVGGNLLSVSVPLEEVIDDIRLSRAFEMGTQTHNISLGAYLADVNFRFDRYMSTSLLEVRDQARRLDIVAVNDTGDVVGSVTENGFLRHGSLYDNNRMHQQTYAFYASDEWQVNDKLRIDLGARYEKIQIDGSVENETTVNLGDATTLADDAIFTGTGVYTDVDKAFDGWAWTAGVNYQFSDAVGAFARYTDSFRLPNGSTYTGNPNREGVVVEGTKMAEVGLKWTDEKFDLYLTGFYSVFDGLQFTTNVFDSVKNEFIQQFGFADTETYGIEAEGIIMPVEWFDLGFSATFQKPEYSKFDFEEVVNGELVPRSFSGQQLIRVPEMMVRLSPGINLMDGRVRAQMDISHFSKRYADVANTVELAAYTTIDANLRFDVADGFSVYAQATNLTNSLGLTEGNPRAGEFIGGNPGAEFYLGRPLLGRTFRVSVAYKF
ncbi:TonB-dependent receptor [Pseudokordiimonas caeni]|uniref:TonB-dependent receptor n=1 Tax=Pseudokordiimonas caeni TaxID=2997908 RepID=UPI00281184BE|nr:TonB-dependent receptor [Pseudokordiimonas caeni]